MKFLIILHTTSLSSTIRIFIDIHRTTHLAGWAQNTGLR
jgi:hypothetical protein